eukprot:IDg19846t1
MQYIWEREAANALKSRGRERLRRPRADFLRIQALRGRLGSARSGDDLDLIYRLCARLYPFRGLPFKRETEHGGNKTVSSPIDLLGVRQKGIELPQVVHCRQIWDSLQIFGDACRCGDK